MFTAAEAFEIATRYYRAGQLAPAEQMFRFVLEQAPDHAESLHFLGGIALQVGSQEQAVAFMRKATESDSTNGLYWNDLGVACVAAGRFREGAAAFERALLFRPQYAEAYNNLGLACHQLGEAEKALACFEQAIQLNPSFADAYNNLGNALREQGQPEEAVTACEQALRLRPQSAEAANNLGIALQESGKVDEAMEYYRQALQLRPNFADASNNLATGLKELGLLDEAATQYRHTLQLQPNHALVYYNLSQLVADGRFSFRPEELDRLKALVAAGSGTVAERSALSFALAAVLERQGSYDEAFHYYQRANAVRRQQLVELNRAFDSAKLRAQVEQVVATFDEAYFQAVQGWGIDTELPVFVLGVPRSGTTLVEQILASHPEVFGAGELGDIARTTRLARQAGDEDRYAAPRPVPTEAAARDLAAGYLRGIEQVGGPARRVTVKTIENYMFLGVIATLLPRARVIYCRRDPLDVCVSCYCQNFQGMDFSWSLEDIGVYYRQYERLMAHWRQALPLPILDVSYEELIAHPETVTRKMVEFCGLEWHERCLAFFNNPRAVRTASTVQVRKPLSTKSIGRWKRFRGYLAPLFQALGLSANGDAPTHHLGKKDNGPAASNHTKGAG